MTTRAWTTPEKFVLPVAPAGEWALVHEFIPPNTVVKVESSGRWHFDGAAGAVGPNGDPTFVANPDDRPMTSVPHGAVIAKLGGGTAGNSGGTLYGGGAFFVIATDATTCGPLYIALNLDRSRMRDTPYRMTVTISTSPR